jgi:hypothetical protein
MGLNTEERQNIVYFTGYEVEHTVCYGMKTLFVVGTPPLAEILQQANRDVNIKHIYFGTSQSFNPANYDDWKTWSDRITGCLDENYWVTLDFDVKYAEEIHEDGWCENNKFVPMISVKLPYIKLYNYNTTLKIDDRTWGATNPGVWTHQLHNLMPSDKFTYWDQYTQDTPAWPQESTDL